MKNSTVIDLTKNPIPFVTDTTYEVDLTDKITFGNLVGDTINQIFTDGRIAGLIAEHFLTDIFKDLKRAESEKAPYDVYHTKWMHGYESRTVTKRGVSYCPSYMLGKGRSYNEKEHHDKIDNVYGFILFDIVNMPLVKITVVSHQHKEHSTLYKRNQSYKGFCKTFYRED